MKVTFLEYCPLPLLDPPARKEDGSIAPSPPPGSTAPVRSHRTPLVGVVGGPESGQLPVEGPGGHDDGHEAGGGQAQQDAHSYGGRSHHARYRGILRVHAPGGGGADY